LKAPLRDAKKKCAKWRARAKQQGNTEFQISDSNESEGELGSKAVNNKRARSLNNPHDQGFD
jgi:hypothetical protein